jgi:hypothetical protein
MCFELWCCEMESWRQQWLSIMEKWFLFWHLHSTSIWLLVIKLFQNPSYVSSCWIFHSWLLFGFPFYLCLCGLVISWLVFFVVGIFDCFCCCCNVLHVKFKVLVFYKSSYCYNFSRFYITLVLFLIYLQAFWCLLFHWLQNTSWENHITTTQ